MYEHEEVEENEGKEKFLNPESTEGSPGSKGETKDDKKKIKLDKGKTKPEKEKKGCC